MKSEQIERGPTIDIFKKKLIQLKDSLFSVGISNIFSEGISPRHDQIKSNSNSCKTHLTISLERANGLIWHILFAANLQISIKCICLQLAICSCTQAIFEHFLFIGQNSVMVKLTSSHEPREMFFVHGSSNSNHKTTHCYINPSGLLICSEKINIFLLLSILHVTPNPTNIVNS